MIEIYQPNGYEITYMEFESFNFPAGEKHIKIKDNQFWFDSNMTVRFIFDSNDSIIELLLVCDALRRMKYKLATLVIPYCPFAQQDRVMVPGEPLSIKVFCDLINSLGFAEVIITDPHSDVTPALLNNCTIIPQWEVFRPFLEGKNDYWIISPDQGSAKKANKLASIVNSLGVIHCEKLRDVKTGQILETIVHAEDLNGKKCVIVDDITVGGRTFIEIAKVLKTKKNAGPITLMTTHFFLKDLSKFDWLIGEVYSKDGKIK